MALVGRLGILATTPPPPYPGCTDCRTGTQIVIVVIVLAVILGLVYLGWRRADDVRGRSRPRRRRDRPYDH